MIKELVFGEDLRQGTVVLLRESVFGGSTTIGIVLDIKRTGTKEIGTLKYLVLCAGYEPEWMAWGFIDGYFE